MKALPFALVLATATVGLPEAGTVHGSCWRFRRCPVHRDGSPIP